MERKENDLMMNIVANPSFTLQDFATIGFDVSNTSLQDKSVYRNNPTIQEKFKDIEGKFDEKLFSDTYNKALLGYNVLSQESYLKDQENLVSFHRSDIFAPDNKKRKGPDFQQIDRVNPDQIQFSITKLGEIGQKTKSTEEIAEKNKVLLNPTEVANGYEAKWGEAPDGNFLKYFTDTLVLAQYDKDEVDKEGVQHKKGELKLNDEGSYYYEALDGRDIYGKQVLSKLNIITEEGSAANRFDFLDSDDLNKSTGGTVLKNLFLVGSMFLPYGIGSTVAGASVITQLAGLTATLGKMLSGSENSTLSAIEGWSEGFNRQIAKSEYAKNKTWCWENFINLIGDVAGQLKEQRFIFEKIPSLVAGDIATEAGQTRMLEKFTKASKKYTEKQISALKNKYGLGDKFINEVSLLKGTEDVRAKSALEAWVKQYNELGGILSKGYMTAITVGDTYGEAKAAGASDIDATLLTLGYAAGEYALLNTGIGEWILPELRANRYKSEAIARAITGNIREQTQVNIKKFGNLITNMPKENKMKWAKDLFNEGKNIANAVYANGQRNGFKALGSASIAGGLGEGVEETTEELLADFSKACYNTVNWLRGEDVRLSSFGFSWENGKRNFNGQELFDRYSMSFLGGIVGGGLTNLGTNYNITSFQYTPESAKRELVYMARQGQLDEIRRVVSKMKGLGNPNQSATEFEQVGNINVMKPGTPNNNQELFAKKAVMQYLDFIENTLNAEGINLSDDEFLNKALGDLRYYQLNNSITSVSLLEDFNTLNTDILTSVANINLYEKKKKDLNGDGITTDREERSTTENKTAEDYDKLIKEEQDNIKEKKKQLEELVSGKSAAKYAGQALIEMIPYIHQNILPISFPLFVKSKYGKDFNQLSDVQKKEAKEAFESWEKINKAEQIKYATGTFMDIIQNFSNTLRAQNDAYKNQDTQLLNVVSQLTDIYENLVKDSNALGNSTDALNKAALYDALAPAINTEQYNNAVTAYNDKITKLQEDTTISDANKNLLAIQYEKEFAQEINSIVENNIFDLANKFIQQGFINGDVKRQLSSILNSILSITESEYDEYENDEDSDPEIIKENAKKLKQIKDTIKAFENLENTPFEKNLNEFAISYQENPINFNQLMSIVDNLLKVNKNDLSQLDLSEITSKEIDNAIKVIQLYQAAINASRIDYVGIDNIWGFSKTINEIAEKTGNPINLAEIDSEFANVLLNDLENAKQKLLFVKAQYNFNQGNKLVEQEKTAANTYRIVYNKVKTIVSVLDDEDDELKSILQPFRAFINSQANFPILEKISSSSSYTLSPDEKTQIQKEITSIGDAIYDLMNNDFFKRNENIQKFFNPKRFNVYGSTFDEFLNKDTKDLNDITFLYYFISRATIKESQLMSLYKNVINPDSGIAPIIPQELAIYNIYANIMNGDRYSQIVNTFNQSVKNDWISKSEADRFNLLQQFNTDSQNKKIYEDDDLKELCKDENIELFLLLLPTSKYDNLTLAEGIAGSGKTSAVFNIVYSLIKPNIKKVWITHACDPEGNPTQAKAIQDKLGAEGALFTKETFLRKICPSYKETFKDSDYSISDGKLVCKWPIVKGLTDVPPVIFIDEIGKFNAFELSIVDKFAKEYGATVVCAGDFDQTKNQLNISLNSQSSIPSYIATSKRQDFIHSPKLGVSMRTDNEIKTFNNNEFAFLKRAKKSIKLRYYEGEDGSLYGDKVFNNLSKNYIDSVVSQVKNIIKTLKPGETIKYIYQPNSDLDKALSVAGITEYLERIPEDNAQGREARYYIVETVKLNKDSDKDTIKDVLYTGSTRAEQGAILVTSSLLLDISSDKTLELITEKYTKNIPQFTKARKKILFDLFPDNQNIPFIQRKKSLIHPVTQPSQPNISPQRRANPQPQPPRKLTQNEVLNKYPYADISGFKITYNNTEIPIELVNIPFNDGNVEGECNVVEFSGEKIALVKVGDFYQYYCLINDKWYPFFNPISIQQSYYNNDFLETISNELNKQLNVTEAPKSTKPIDSKFKFIDPLQGPNLARNMISRELQKYSIDSKYNYSARDAVRLKGEEGVWVISSVNAYSNAPTTYEVHTKGYEGYSFRTLYKTVSEDEIEEVVYSPFIEAPNLPFPTEEPVIYNGKKGIIDYSSLKYDFEKGPCVTINYNDGKIEVISQKNFDKITKPIPEPERIFPDEIFNEDSEVGTSVETDDSKIKNNLDEVNTTPKFTPKFKRTKNTIQIRSLLHSFNMLCPGVLFDSDGNILPDIATDADGTDINMHELRIDGVNGLMHIEDVLIEIAKQTNNWNDVDTKVWNQTMGVSQKDWYLKNLAELQNIILNAESREEILNHISSILGYDAEFINFAFKTSPPPTQKSRDEGITYFINNIKNWGKYGISAQETSEYNPSDDTNSDRVIPHRLVALIGDRKHGEICEIPLLSLSNPITLIKSTFTGNEGAIQIFKEISDVWDTLRQTKSIHDSVEDIINLFKDREEYIDIINLFRLFSFNESGLFRINYATNTEKASNIYRDWLPSRDLQNMGLRITTDPGRYTEQDGYEIRDKSKDLDRTKDEKWKPLINFANNPRFSVSSIMVSKQSGLELDNGITIENHFQAGHEFVLIGTPDLKTDTELINYYIKQQSDPNIIPKVQLVYILPPTASYQEYLESIVNKLNGVNDPRFIGNLFTPFQILNILFQDNRIIQALTEDYWGNRDRIQSIINLVGELQDLYTISQDESNPEKDKAYNELIRRLKEYREFEDMKMPTVSYLVKVLETLTKNPGKDSRDIRSQEGYRYPSELDSNIIDIINEDLNGANYTIYHKGNRLTKYNIGPFVKVQSDGYSLNGRSYSINGKIDTTYFIGDIGPLVSLFLSKINNGQSRDRYLTPSNEQFIPNIHLNNYQKNADLVKSIIGEEAFNNLNITIPANTNISQEQLKQYNDKMVRAILNSGKNQLAFHANGIIYSTNWIYNNQPIPTDINTLVGQESIDNFIQPDGTYKFLVIANSSKYTIDFNPNSGLIETTLEPSEPPIVTTKKEVVSIMEQEWVDNIDNFRSLSVSQKPLKALAKFQTFEEFMQGLTKYITSPSTSAIDRIRKVIQDLDDSPTKDFIQKIVDYVDSQRNQDDTPSCNIGPTIKI